MRFKYICTRSRVSFCLRLKEKGHNYIDFDRPSSDYSESPPHVCAWITVNSVRSFFMHAHFIQSAFNWHVFGYGSIALLTFFLYELKHYEKVVVVCSICSICCLLIVCVCVCARQKQFLDDYLLHELINNNSWNILFIIRYQFYPIEKYLAPKHIQLNQKIGWVYMNRSVFLCEFIFSCPCFSVKMSYKYVVCIWWLTDFVRNIDWGKTKIQ